MALSAKLLFSNRMPKRLRPEKHSPTPPERDVTERQEPKHSERDFLRDLERATTNRAAEKLERASRRDPASPKT